MENGRFLAGGGADAPHKSWIECEYSEVVAKSLQQFFPDFLGSDTQLPLLRWSYRRGHLKIFFISRRQWDTSKFFFEMIYRWLTPGRRLNVACLFSTDFQLTAFPQATFVLAEMTIRIEQAFGLDRLEHNLKVIENEMRWGMSSGYHASRLLEPPFSSPLQKISQIQEKITMFIERNPHTIEYGIFGVMQQFIVMSREEFKTHRSPSHLSRMIAAFYLFTKSIDKARQARPDKRHIRMKTGPVVLDLPWGPRGPREVVGICVALNFLSSQELFEERHLIGAVQNILAGVKAVPHSFYLYAGESKDIVVLYVEVEKEKGDLFTAGDRQQLRTFLPEEIKRAVEIPLKSIFMPRNEEEILRYIVTLAGQLRFVKDLPQVILMFDEQKAGELYFTVVLVRLLSSASYSIHYLFGQSDTFLKFEPDRVKRVGFLRKRYPKESTVFRVHFSSLPFLREDQSVDLFRARQVVFQELEKIIGNLRDYTGGMLAKQVELIDQIHELLGEKDRLLEPFFHALYPVEARSFLPSEQVKNWFMLWKQLLEFPEDNFKIERDHAAVYVIGQQAALPELDPADFAESQLITACPRHSEKYLGYLFISRDIEEQQSFIAKLQAYINREKEFPI